MTGLTAIREALGPALEDARSIIAERWLISACIGLTTYLIALDVLANWHNANAVIWLTLPGIWVVGFLCYEGAMRRIVSPDLTSLVLTRFVGLTLLTYGLILLIAIPLGLATVIISISPALKTAVIYGAYYVFAMLVGTKLAFAPFSLNDWGVFASCARSWEITGKRTFWPTFLVSAPYWILWFVVTGALNALRQVASPLVWVTIKVPVDLAIALVAASFTYSILARWMAWCEKLYLG